jgi:hypothetical protein
VDEQPRRRDPAADASPTALLTDVSRAREQTLAVLERLSQSHTSSDVGAKTRCALQTAANELGFVQHALAVMAEPVKDVPAPIVDPDARARNLDGTRWSGEASAVMALAEFSVPYASTPAEEVENWLRVLRREGTVGRALAELGFPEAELTSRAEPAVVRRPDALESVRAGALAFARRRDAAALSTADIFFAVLAIHDKLVDRALHERGVNRDALLARLAEDPTLTRVAAL